MYLMHLPEGTGIPQRNSDTSWYCIKSRPNKLDVLCPRIHLNVQHPTIVNLTYIFYDNFNNRPHTRLKGTLTNQFPKREFRFRPINKTRENDIALCSLQAIFSSRSRNGLLQHFVFTSRASTSTRICHHIDTD
ncbi:hypothetical protein PM082_006175 [Marasmius tenuissimus]|nr:hypothetical protein PM082_006175 [Marasmius tenuissimus]